MFVEHELRATQVAAAGAALPLRPGQLRRPLPPRPRPVATCRTAPGSPWSPARMVSTVCSSCAAAAPQVRSSLKSGKPCCGAKIVWCVELTVWVFSWQARAPPSRGASGAATPKWSLPAACRCMICASGGLATGRNLTLLPDSTACQQGLLPTLLSLEVIPASPHTLQGRAHRIRAGASGAAGRVQRLWWCAHQDPLLS